MNQYTLNQFERRLIPIEIFFPKDAPRSAAEEWITRLGDATTGLAFRLTARVIKVPRSRKGPFYAWHVAAYDLPLDIFVLPHLS